MATEALPRSQVTVKTTLTVGLTVLGLAAGCFLVIRAIDALVLAFMAMLLAIALDHPVAFLERHRWKRGLGIALMVVLLLGLIAGVALLIIPTAVKQGHSMVESFPKLMQQVRESKVFTTLDRRFHVEQQVQQQLQHMGSSEEQSKVASAGGAIVTPVLKAVGSVISVAASAVILFVLSIFMLIFGPSLVRRMLAEAVPGRRERYAHVLARIRKSIGGYVMGLSLVCTVNATLTTTFLAIARVPFFLPLGILSGFSSLIPYVGPISAGTFITLIAFATKGPLAAVAVAIYYVLYGQLEGHILAPIVFRRTVKISPLLTLLAVLIFGTMAGVTGAVIAVPTVAAIQIIIGEVLELRRERLNSPMVGPVQPDRA